MILPSLYPIYDFNKDHLVDGTVLPICAHCQKSIRRNTGCKQFYQSLSSKKVGYYHCPFGFTTRSFFFGDQLWMMTGVIAYPRFDTANERQMAKRYATHKVARDSMEVVINFLRQVEVLRADIIQNASQVLPQAFHELRKLNGAIIQHAEKEIGEHGETRGLMSIKSAAELMRNNFDILEALSNIEGMRALPSDSTINVFDLCFKMKRVLQEKAFAKRMTISVNGVRAIIQGSQKSFPIVPAVLLENAIKYGIDGSIIHVDISTRGGLAILSVTNETDAVIDTERCFERGARFSTSVEGGGFGLYIAREIVSCHSGKICCELTGGNVHIVVELPLKTVIPDVTGKR